MKNQSLAFWDGTRHRKSAKAARKHDTSGRMVIVMDRPQTRVEAMVGSGRRTTKQGKRMKKLLPLRKQNQDDVLSLISHGSVEAKLRVVDWKILLSLVSKEEAGEIVSEIAAVSEVNNETGKAEAEWNRIPNG